MTAAKAPNSSAVTERSQGALDAARPLPIPQVGPEAAAPPAAATPVSAEPRGGEHAKTYGRHQSAPDIELQLRLMRLTDTVVILTVLLGAFLVANIGHTPNGFAEFLAMRVTVKNLALLTGFALSWRLLCRITGIYDWKVIRSRRAESTRVILTCGLVSAVALMFPTVSVTGAFSYGVVPAFWIGSSLTILLFRNLVRTIVPVPETDRVRDALIVGTGPRAQRLARELQNAGPEGLNVVGFMDSRDHRPAAPSPEAFLGSLDQLESVLMHHAVDEVLITLPIKSAYADIQSVLEICERVGVPARYLADLFEPTNGRVHYERERPMLLRTPPAPQGWRLVAKRVIDLVGASSLLLALTPLLLLVAVGIKLTSRGPVLFAQERYGLKRRLFRMYKFRTMVADAETQQSLLEVRNEASGPVFKIREDPRITRFGRLLRRTSIDELPQLVNVLRGEMSLVGPRPLPVRDVHRFAEAALMRRFSIRPGVTCLWQISGRCDIGFDEWIRLDLKYIDEWSLSLDLLILLKTLPAVIRGTGAA
jgi:exopolysaccharide biosynthesis polyprenyl glycosylphosphotransferase